MKQRYISLVLAAMLLLSLLCTACQEIETPDDTGDMNSADLNGLDGTQSDPIVQKLSTLLSAEDMTAAAGGLPMFGPEMHEYNTIARYQNETESLIVEISLDYATADSFSTLKESISEPVTDAPNLCEAAFWVEEYRVLYAMDHGYMLSISLIGDTVSNGNALIIARNIAGKAFKTFE